MTLQETAATLVLARDYALACENAAKAQNIAARKYENLCEYLDSLIPRECERKGGSQEKSK